MIADSIPDDCPQLTDQNGRTEGSEDRGSGIGNRGREVGYRGEVTCDGADWISRDSVDFLSPLTLVSFPRFLSRSQRKREVGMDGARRNRQWSGKDVDRAQLSDQMST